MLARYGRTVNGIAGSGDLLRGIFDPSLFHLVLRVNPVNLTPDFLGTFLPGDISEVRVEDWVEADVTSDNPLRAKLGLGLPNGVRPVVSGPRFIDFLYRLCELVEHPSIGLRLL
jgi:hypothetical protein